jgi:type II secretory pathway component GspD/PulD (secretin)
MVCNKGSQRFWGGCLLLAVLFTGRSASPAEAGQTEKTEAPLSSPVTAKRRADETGPGLDTRKRLFDLEADQEEIGPLVRRLSKEAGVNIALVGAVSGKVSVSIHKATFPRLLDLVAKSAALVAREEEGAFLIGAARDVEAAATRENVVQIYRCQHIGAAGLVAALMATLDPQQVKCAAGAVNNSPRLEKLDTSAITGQGGGAMQPLVGVDSNVSSHEVVLSGEKQAVANAMDLCAQLDIHRGQVKINVKITDINLDSLREMGVQYTWSDYAVKELDSASGPGSSPTAAPPGINFGRFTHLPVSLDAKLTLLETQGRAKLLASPSMSLLDGERGFILIGQRLLYPKLTGYTQAQTPIYDKEEVRVGIYLQVAVQMTDHDDILMTIYPQVSVITGYLTVQGGSYPQISTREQQTTVRIKDREVLVVGGLIRDEEINNIQRVPLLSRIPILGELFTYRHKTRSHSELVITITPEIEKDDPHAEMRKE